MPSFDITCEANAVELKNAVETANKEIANRFDFKGSDARFELKEKEHEITAFADDEFKLGQVRDVLLAKMAKRIVKMLKDGKLKVTASIQGDVVRVTGAKKDALQEAIQVVRAGVTDVPLRYENFRD